jgi:hypothetical protein
MRIQCTRKPGNQAGKPSLQAPGENPVHPEFKLAGHACKPHGETCAPGNQARNSDQYIALHAGIQALRPEAKHETNRCFKSGCSTICSSDWYGEDAWNRTMAWTSLWLALAGRMQATEADVLANEYWRRRHSELPPAAAD